MFMQDVLAIAPGNMDTGISERLYEKLSARAQETTSPDTMRKDIAQFLSIQDVPDQGISVEDLQIHSDTEASLIVGLNYTGGRTLRAIHLLKESGAWKVDSAEVLDSYPPEAIPDKDEMPTSPEIPVTPPPSTDTPPTAKGECYIGGCSGHICSDVDSSDFVTTCEWREEYACYRSATCERQANGECGWTPTTALTQCIANTQ
jgi:hypothetical protein